MFTNPKKETKDEKRRRKAAQREARKKSGVAVVNQNIYMDEE